MRRFVRWTTITCGLTDAPCPSAGFGAISRATQGAAKLAIPPRQARIRNVDLDVRARR